MVGLPLLSRVRTLPVQSFALIVVPMVALLILVAYGGISLHEHAMRALVAERDARAIRAAAETLADRFAQRQMMLQMLAEQLADGATFDHVLADNPDVRHIFDGGLMVADRDGVITASWLPGLPWSAALRNAGASWTFEHDSSDALLVVNTASANGEVRLSGGLSLDSLNVPGALGIIRDDPQIRLFLVDGDGHVILDSAGESAGHLARDVPALAAYLSVGGMENHAGDAAHDDLVTVSALTDGLGWQLITQEQWAEVASPALRLSLVAPLALIPAMLVATGVLWFGMVRIVTPLRRLGRAATALSWGNYDALRQPVGGVQEIGELQTTLNHMAQRVRQAQAGMHSYIGAMLRGQEEERKRIARELHDDTLQSLIALDQRRQMVQRALERDPQAAPAQLHQMRTMVDHMITSLRHMIRDMRPTYIEELGLAPALEMLCAQAGAGSPPHLTFSAAGTPHRLPTEQEIGLYRIAQEAVTNALRHAAATRVEVRLVYGDSAELSVADDGRGFTVPARPEALAQATHYGLLGMVERAEQMGAQFHIDSEPGRGTCIRVSVPRR
ncbi:MAG: HAMP domain-containing protein [Anaerolineae bacterium]|nr:HAMP domain-containing protein [Anaerolineae bacterium]